MSVGSPIFPTRNRTTILRALRKIPVVGRPLRTRRNLACSLCGGSVLPLGRLPWPGTPLCRRSPCEFTSMPKITEQFPTPYGRALDQRILRIFCRVLEKDRIIIQRNPVLEHAEPLVDAYLELIEWQKAFDTWERLESPDTHTRGAIHLVPPRALDDVLVFRALRGPVSVDPTRHLPLDTARVLRRIKNEGPIALEVPF